jgi:DNA adenine methylase
MHNKKGASAAQNRDETGVAQHQANMAAGKVAANDPGYAKAFNKAGIIEKPGFSKHHRGAGSCSDATLFAHKVCGQWLGGFAYAIRDGSCAGETMLPSVFNGRYELRKLALADAASRLLASLQTKYPDTGRPNNAEAALVKKLREWAKRFLLGEPATEAQSFHLAGRSGVCFKQLQPSLAAANDERFNEVSPSGEAGQRPKRLSKVKAPSRMKGESSYLTWAGAKAWSRAIIEPHLPPNRKRAIFPFGGVASDALGYADIFDDLHIADINSDLVNAHRWISRDPEAAIRSLAPLFRQTGDAKETYLLRRKTFNKMKRGTPERARMFIYLLRHGWRGHCSYNLKGEFNTSFGYRDSFKLPVEAIRRFVAVIGKAKFRRADMLSTLSLAGRDDVVFLDPPYRPKGGAKEHKQYTAKGFPVSTYREMVTAVEAAVQRGATVFAHDHLTKETLGLHPRASEILPVEVTRTFHKAGKVMEAIFIYRPKSGIALVREAPVAARKQNAANDEAFRQYQFQ